MASIGAPLHCLCHYVLRELQIIQNTDVPRKVQLWTPTRNCYEICNWCIFVLSHVTMMIYYHYYYIIRSFIRCGICQHKKCPFIRCYQIFSSYIRLVISAMQFRIKSSLRKILFQLNLAQVFRFGKWNKTWLKMCTKDRTPETDQSFLWNRSLIISFENRYLLEIISTKDFGCFETQNDRVLRVNPKIWFGEGGTVWCVWAVWILSSQTNLSSSAGKDWF